VPAWGQEEKPLGFSGFSPAAPRSSAMSERFFITTSPAAGRAVLLGDEARHLAKVLRAKPGDRVTLFDGSGRSWEGRVATIGRGEVTLEVGEPSEAPPVRLPAITLAVALPKGERQKWLVEKLTELGVARLVPLVTVRGVAAATAGAIERLERGVIEACKQCGRDRLMDIAAPATVTDLVAPEGGFTAQELASAAAAGWPQVALGPHVLRIETAAVALAARLAATRDRT
jgi:16S rRNA (uracil1498-N3)-methyltransferase